MSLTLSESDTLTQFPLLLLLVERQTSDIKPRDGTSYFWGAVNVSMNDNRRCRSLQRYCTVCFMFEQCEGGRLGEDIEVMDGKKL